MGQRNLGFKNPRSWASRFICATLILLISGCTLTPLLTDNNSAEPTATPNPDTTAPTNMMAEFKFVVRVPETTLPDVNIYLNVLDEVTGLAFNATSNQMEPLGNFTYSLSLALPLGSVVKYRYSYEGTPPVVEYNALNQPVRYRMVLVDGPGEVSDIVAAWENVAYSGQSGQITGMVVDQTTQAGIPNMLITAAGMTTISASDGSFVFDNIEPGVHNLVAYSLDGDYQTFQQGAAVAVDSTTPALMALIPAQRVNVQFIVTIPQENVLNLPIRMAGNFYSTGNTFADLRGGFSTIASRMPLLTQMEDGRYSITLSLPVGAYYQYKYTLGDGFWNSEHSSSGGFRLREFIVPEQDTVIEDTITTWRSNGLGPITFDVTVPENTPAEDYVSIQFNPFTWTEPVPMWSLGGNRWLYVLYSPLDFVGSFSYRFCRNDQCGVADDASTTGENAVGVTVQPSDQDQYIQVQIQEWAGLTSDSTVTPVSSAEVLPKGSNFISGIELQPAYHPSWLNRYPVAFSSIKSSGANWVVITPTWTLSTSSIPVLKLIPGDDPLDLDVKSAINQAASQGLSTAIFPTLHSNTSLDEWWLNAPRSSSWWETWFERYTTFILNYADLAQQTNAQALILGGPWVSPALPGGTVMDGSASNAPSDADIQWRTLIEEIRGRYSGTIAWAVNYPDGLQNSTPFLDSVDEIILLWSGSITSENNPTEESLAVEIATELDTTVYQLYTDTGKPIILGIGYPSLDGAATGCKTILGLECTNFEALNQPDPTVSTTTIDLLEQADIYDAFLAAVNQRDWIAGVISRGYYPAAAIQDASLSVDGKPAAIVIWNWFSRWNSTSTQ